MARYWHLIVRILHITCHLIVHVISAQRFGKGSSQYGKMLTGHTFKTVRTGQLLECAQVCNANDKCQSINYVMSSGKCELNDRRMETKPEYFVANPDTIYMTRWVKRGELRTIKRTRNTQKELQRKYNTLGNLSPNKKNHSFC